MDKKFLRVSFKTPKWGERDEKGSAKRAKQYHVHLPSDISDIFSKAFSADVKGRNDFNLTILLNLDIS